MYLITGPISIHFQSKVQLIHKIPTTTTSMPDVVTAFIFSDLFDMFSGEPSSAPCGATKKELAFIPSEAAEWARHY